MALGKKRNSDDLPNEFLHLFVNSVIDHILYRRILSNIKTTKERPTCVVVTLVTLGGSPNDAYRIGRYLQTMFKNVFIHVPTICASAGTLLVCAANRLIISAMSELGPLDAQILKSDEIRTRRSGLVTRSLFENLGNHAFELHTSLVEKIINHSDGAIRYRTAAHVAGEMVVGLLHGLYEQMNPDQIGEDYRFLKIAEEHGKRLSSRSENINEESLHKLVYDFPSHDFIIDFLEAFRLFENVDVPSQVLLDQLKDDERTPVLPRGPRERVVLSSVVQGCPVYREESEAKDNGDGESVTSADEPSGKNGGPSAPGVAGADSIGPRPDGKDANGRSRKTRRRAKAEAPAES
jgi:hypothetical protein